MTTLTAVTAHGNTRAVTLRDVFQARRTLGHALAEWRRAAGARQVDLARMVCWSRSTVANVETGRQRAPRLFWQRCDQVVGARGLLVTEAERAEEVARRYREQVAAERSRQRPAARARLRCCCRVPVGLGWPGRDVNV